MKLNTPTHLEKTLQRDIDLIRAKVLEMAALADRAIKTSLEALTTNNLQLAYSVILRDQYIDEHEKELDRLCLEFLVRQQPVASHLRFVYAALKINNELERIGDYAESVSRQVLKLNSYKLQLSWDTFRQLAELSAAMLRDTVRAFADQNVELARTSMRMEEEADELREKINADLIHRRQEGTLPLEALAPLMTIARRFERVADQAKNMCQEVLYMCTGEYIKHQGMEVFRILFVDEHNSCRSQMAEAIGNSLGLPRFVFSGGGIQPEPIDARTVEFLKQKGIDISRQVSKRFDQVLNYSHYQVVIALAKEAQAAFPHSPTKTICLNWHLADPSKAKGTKEEVEAAYESAYQYIKTHINDLVQAILDDGTSTKP